MLRTGPQSDVRSPEDSGTGGPEIVFRLLITLVLPKYGGLAVPYCPNVDLRRRPALPSSLSTFGAKYHDTFTLGQNVVELDAERAARKLHEMLRSLWAVSRCARQWRGSTSLSR